MNKKIIAAAMVATTAFLLMSGGAFAADPSVKANYETAKKQAASRYAEDRKLCADETISSARMQCLRDAKSESSKSLADAKAAYTQALSAAKAKSATAAAVCADCGKVTSFKVVDQEGKSSPLGLIAGGVAGAVLGHQVGGGSGKDLATIAGAAGGAYAGHKIEQNVRSTKLWVVSVHFDNGEDRTFNFEADPGYVAGDLVKVSGNSIIRR